MNPASPSFKPVILVAPLNWGLGHATRCIPIIRSLLQNDSGVLLSAEGPAKAILQQEFPMLPFVDLPGYQINYSSHKWTMPFHLASQIPKILSGIKQENERLNQLVNEHPVTGIISDNRYGLYHPEVPCAFIGHQMLIKTPFGNLMDEFLQKLNYRYINRFTECWVPDTENRNNLAGDLSHPLISPRIPVKYTGPISRFLPGTEQAAQYLLFILSGPEPQRSILEKIFLDQLKHYDKPAILVRGLPAGAAMIKTPANVMVYDHLRADALEKVIREATYVITRCGYSSVMDLAILKKKSVLIPTPGQTEQEYLAQHLMNTQFALCIEQNKFRLLPALDLAAHFHYRINEFETISQLDTIVKNFITRPN
jgi:UDP:flavonoid glycosyltransferase YjiC (YdhE family)